MQHHPSHQNELDEDELGSEKVVDVVVDVVVVVVVVVPALLRWSSLPDDSNAGGPAQKLPHLFLYQNIISLGTVYLETQNQ